MDKRTRLVGYVRVSTAKQAEEGLSLEAQEARLRAYAVAMDVDLVAVEADAGQSAKSLDRPALQRALSALTEGRADGLLVVKLDRLTRSVADLGTLIEGYFSRRYSLLSVGDSIDTRSAAGELVLNILTSVAQWERKAIGERTVAGMAFCKAQGRTTGTPVYGFAAGSDGRLVPVESEQAVIREARELRTSGMSLRAVTDALETRGRVSRKGRPLQLTQVARLLKALPGPS